MGENGPDTGRAAWRGGDHVLRRDFSAEGLKGAGGRAGFAWDPEAEINVDRPPDQIAEGFGAESQTSGSQETAPSLFLTDSELAALPPVEWDIDGILPTGGLSFLVGQPGTGKSLLALWFASCISLGVPWVGRKVRRGRVIYVAAEGARSLHSRLEIWKSYYDHEKVDTGIRWMPQRLDLRDPRSVSAFLLAASDVTPRLVIIDTLGRCTQGAKENDSDGMGEALGAVDRIRETLETSVLLLAHPSRDGGDSPRGHSSQDGAADAIWVLKDEDGSRILSCAKLKDGDESTEVRLALVQRWESVVLIPADKAGVQQSLTPGQLKVMATIRGTDCGGGVSTPTLIDAGKVPKSSVYHILKNLTTGRCRCGRLEGHGGAPAVLPARRRADDADSGARRRRAPKRQEGMNSNRYLHTNLHTALSAAPRSV